jgi:hypothetical protein
LREEHAELAATIGLLEAEQGQVTDASDEARSLSQKAVDRLFSGTDLIRASLEPRSNLREAHVVQSGFFGHTTRMARMLIRASEQFLSNCRDRRGTVDIFVRPGFFGRDLHDDFGE